MSRSEPAPPRAPRLRAPRRPPGIAGVVAGAVLAWSSAALATDLFEVYRLATENDPAYRAATAAHEAALEATDQAWAPLRPQAGTSASLTPTRQTFNEVTNAFFTERFSLSVTQAVYRRDLFVALRQARNTVAKADVDYAFARQDLMLRVAQAYFDVLNARDDVVFARANKEAIGQQLRQARQRFDVGLIAITGVEEAKARFDLATADELRAVNALSDAREVLHEITGLYHDDLATLGEEVPLVTPEPVDIEAWTETALEQNLRVASANYDVLVARQEIERIRSGHYPSFDLVGEYSHLEGGSSGLQGGDREIDSASLTFQLSVPLYQGGLVVSQTREARAQHRQFLSVFEQTRRSVQSQTRRAFLGIQSGIARVRALRQALVSTRSALDAVEAGFQVGTRTSVDVLDAQRDLFQARFDYAAARYEYLVNILTLKQAAGTLSEEDVRAINDWLEERPATSLPPEPQPQR